MSSEYLKKLIKLGVEIKSPENVFIEESCKLEAGVVIYPFNTIKGNTVIKKGTILRENNYIVNSEIGENNDIVYSFIEDSKIGNFNKIGPFSRLRSGAFIHDNVKIGNFVEIKKSVLKNGVKAGHLAYVGDGEVGENVNISCGVIFCNYNGKEKFKTKVGKNAFIGSNVNLIAPVSVGENSFISAGATINKNIEKDKFVVGNRELKIKEDIKKIHIKEK